MHKWCGTAFFWHYYFRRNRRPRGLQGRENIGETSLCRRGLHGVVACARLVQNIATEEACSLSGVVVSSSNKYK